MSPELEAKLIAPDEMQLPDLNGIVEGATAVRLPERHLEAVYYDTAELQLARSGITMRYRIGVCQTGWHIRLLAWFVVVARWSRWWRVVR
jgi:hypothetical protein